jgi:hypothetical protein
MKNPRLLLVLTAGLSLAAVSGRAATLALRWLEQEIILTYDPDMVIEGSFPVEERALRQAYEQLHARPYAPLWQSLMATREQLQLNDWLYYNLLDQALRQIYRGLSEVNRELTVYLLLAESGFDVRLTYRHRSVQVNAYTEETLYEIPLIAEDGRRYANLSQIGQDYQRGQSMYLLNHRPRPLGRPFEFRLRDWPSLPARPRERLLAFRFRGETMELRISYDQTTVDLLADYPLLDEAWYHEAPLSATLRQSLLPVLREKIAPLNQQEALEFLVAFTRSGFAYREDYRIFGGSKPMVADEVFHYSYSDCEDRTALFFTLVRELLDLPMIILAYEDHLSIAVEAPQVKGQAVNYGGRRYVFCDPTGPYDSSRIGEIPDGYENASFRVIGTHK